MRKILIGFIVSLVVMTGLLAASSRPTHAQDEALDTAEISKKLDTVLENQKDMMADIKAMKEELNIVKIRVTQIQ